MSSLAISKAPPLARPLRFLLTVPLWGCIAGGWLAWHGDALLVSRWTPATVALVHFLTLGVLGNAMLGALLQFLPVAAASPPPGAITAPLTHVMLNAGLPLLAIGLVQGSPPALAGAAALLGLALLLAAAEALRALLGGGAPRALRLGLGTALTGLVFTAVLGVVLCFGLAGGVALPLDRLTDLHAATGLLGWVLMLIAAVSTITMPMFQNTPRAPPWAFIAWIALAAAGLLAGGAWRLAGAPDALALCAAIPALLLMCASLALQWRAPQRRNPALTRFWACGSLAVAAACLWLLAASFALLPESVMPGVLGLGIGLPLMLTGMLLEITAFLAWVRLRLSGVRGKRIPNTEALMPEKEKSLLLTAHLAAATLLAATPGWPGLAQIAGLALLCAYAFTGSVMVRCLLRAKRFLDSCEIHP